MEAISDRITIMAMLLWWELNRVTPQYCHIASGPAQSTEVIDDLVIDTRDHSLKIIFGNLKTEGLTS